MKRVIVFTFACLISVFAIAGNGDGKKLKTVTGNVVDGQMESMVGVRIEIVELEKTVYTDFDGNFTLQDLRPGSYTIKVSQVSYQAKEATVYNIDVESSTTLDIQLESK